MAELQKLIKPLYQRFVCCVDFYLHNKKIFGSILDRLSNSKRKELQSAEQNADKPTIVDFFAGAGGLSCGFVQAGFKVCLANDFEDVCVRTYRFN
ncbi:MAG: DNA cytosine methyltransferase, partial [Clostridia bacterium]|nr:DNA cytosine methyltransferase [Clostridia bacterium]